MNERATTAAGKPAHRARTHRHLERTAAQRRRASLETDRRLERDAASLEPDSFPEALIGVPFN